MNTSNLLYNSTKSNKTFFNCFSSKTTSYTFRTTRGLLSLHFISYHWLSILFWIPWQSTSINIAVKHHKKQSMRVLLIISICDILHGAIGYTAHIGVMLAAEQLNCTYRRIILFFPSIFIYQSSFLVMFIALDRFLHVMFLTRYSTVVTSLKFNFLLTFFVTVALIQAAINTFGPAFLGYAGGARYTAPTNAIFTLITLILYIISIKKLKLVRRKSGQISSQVSNMTKLASAFLLLITICYTPAILFQFLIPILRRKLDKTTFIVTMHATILISICNSSGNAIVYLSMNPKAKRKFKELFTRMVKKSNHVQQNYQDTRV